MANALAFFRHTAAHPGDLLRIAIVAGCSLALIAADNALPF